jgi:hypothetical protein
MIKLEVGTVISSRTFIQNRRDFSLIIKLPFRFSFSFSLFFQAVMELFYFAEIVPDSDLRVDSSHHSDYHSGSYLTLV